MMQPSTRTTLERLARHLASVHPELSARLQPGITPPAWTASTDDLPFQPADEVASLYAWHDGVADAQGYELFPDGYFPSWEEALEARRTNIDIARMLAAETGLDPQRLWDERWLPVFTTAGGDLYVTVADAEPRPHAPILRITMEDREHPVAMYDSLADMLATLAAAYEQGAYRVDDEGFVTEDALDVARIRREIRAVAPAAQGDGTALLADLVEGDDARQQAAYAALAATLDPHMVEPLTRALHHQRSSARYLTARLLHEMKDARAVPPLIEALADDEGFVRAAAAAALGAIGDPRAVEPLIVVAAEADGRTHTPALWALEQIEGERSTAALTHLLRHGADANRAATALALGRREDPLATPALIEALDDVLPDVRRNALWALGVAGDAAAEAPLAARLADPNPSLRAFAQTALLTLLERMA